MFQINSIVETRHERRAAPDEPKQVPIDRPELSKVANLIIKVSITLHDYDYHHLNQNNNNNNKLAKHEIEIQISDGARVEDN